MRTSGESANTIATALGVSRATVYRVLTEYNGVDWFTVRESRRPPTRRRICQRRSV